MILDKLLIISIFFYTFTVVFFGKLDHLIIQYIANIVLIIVFLIRRLFKGKIKLPIQILLFLVLTIYGFVGAIFWSLDFNLSFLMGVRLLSVALASIVIFNYLLEFGSAKVIYYAFFISLIINFLMFFDIINLGLETFVNFRFVGSNENANVAGMISVFTIYLAYNNYEENKNKYAKWMYFFVLVMAIILVFASGSRKALVMGVLLISIAHISYMIDNKKIIINIVLFPIILFFLLNLISTDAISDLYQKALERLELLIIFLSEDYIGDSSIGERVYFVSKGLDVFYNNVILGVGLDNMKVFIGTYTHNNFVELLSTGGIVGFSMYYGIHLFTIIKALKNRKRKFFAKLQYYHLLFLIFLIILDFGLVSYVARYYQLVLVYSIYLILYKIQ